MGCGGHERRSSVEAVVHDPARTIETEVGG